MLTELKKFDPDRANMEELVALSAFAKSYRAEFTALNLEVPEWLDDKTRILQREILARGRDVLEKRLKDARAASAALMTPSEKRAALAAEIAALEAQLVGAAK